MNHSRWLLLSLACGLSGALRAGSCGDSLWCVTIGNLRLESFDNYAPNAWYNAAIENFKREEDIDDPEEMFFVPEWYVPWICKQYFPGRMRADSVASALEAHLKARGMTGGEEPSPATTIGLKVENTNMLVQYVKGGCYRFRLYSEWSLTDAVTGEVAYTKAVATTTAVVNEADVPYERQLNAGFIEGLDQVLADPAFQALRKRRGTRFSTTYYDQPVIDLAGPAIPAASANGALKSVVTVIGSKGTGSGTVLATDGHVVCGHAVIEKSDEEVRVRMNDGSEKEGRVVRVDRFSGLVLLKVEGLQGIVSRVKDADLPEIGDDITVLGTPGTGDLSPALSKGILSGYRSIDGLDLIETDAPMAPGNAGGPMLDANANVIGVIVGKVRRQGAEGLGFALRITAVEEALRIRIPR